jgi:hypothetical protein
MKSLIIFAFSIITHVSFSQGNLQFNQVLTVSSTDVTVPAGKVWKVESYQQQQVSYSFNNVTTNCSDLSRPRPYYINNIAYHRILVGGSGLSNVPVSAINEFPIWLKAGQTLRTSCPGDFLSVIEFNIVP